jgi:CheY-like chemotaxis protein
MDGWQFLNTVTERYPKFSDIPVILVTATVVEDGYRQDKYGNIVDVLMKPFEMNDLTSAIDRALMARSRS